MSPILADKATVNPPPINFASNFLSENDSGDPSPSPRCDGSSREDDEPTLRPDGDPFVPGATYRAKRKCPSVNAVSVLTDMMGMFQEKFQNDREMKEESKAEEQNTREEEKKRGEEMLDIMKETSQSINALTSVLQTIANKM